MTLPDQDNLEDFVAELESEFSARYSEQDADYARTETSLLEGEFNDPPILAPWRVWEPRVNNHSARGGRQGNQDRFHSNAENRRQGNHFGNRYERNRPHHAKPYDRPSSRRGGQDRSRYNNRHEGNRFENRHEGNRFENRHEGNRFENRHGGNRSESDRYERGGVRAPSAYDRRPGRPGLGFAEAEEERRYGHQHPPDTKRGSAPDDSEWT